MPGTNRPAKVAVPEGAFWCGGCRRVKPLAAFYPRRSEPGRVYYGCRACKRAARVGAGPRPGYERSPARVEAKRRWDAAHAEARRAADRAKVATPLGKLMRQRRWLRWAAAKAADPVRRAYSARSLPAVEAEIARIQGNAGTTGRARPGPKPSPTARSASGASRCRAGTA